MPFIRHAAGYGAPGGAATCKAWLGLAGDNSLAALRAGNRNRADLDEFALGRNRELVDDAFGAGLHIQELPVVGGRRVDRATVGFRCCCRR